MYGQQKMVSVCGKENLFHTHIVIGLRVAPKPYRKLLRKYHSIEEAMFSLLIMTAL